MLLASSNQVSALASSAYIKTKSNLTSLFKSRSCSNRQRHILLIVAKTQTQNPFLIPLTSFYLKETIYLKETNVGRY